MSTKNKIRILVLLIIFCALPFFLTACHTPKIQIQSKNINCGCSFLVTYRVPGSGASVPGGGPHQLAQSVNAAPASSAFEDLGSGFGTSFSIDYTIIGDCFTPGTGQINGILPTSNWFIDWTCGSAAEGGPVPTATAVAQSGLQSIN